MTPEEQAAARMVEQYGERAKEIMEGLIESCVSNDHRRGGELCREMHDDPNLLLLVVGFLTSAVVSQSVGSFAQPEELGIDPEELQPQPWEVGAIDQMEAAAEHNDINRFAQIGLDAQIRAYADDARRITARGGELPDVETLMRGFMVMDRVTAIALAAEGLRRLVEKEVQGG